MKTVFEKAKRALSAANQVCASSGVEGLEELRVLYPDSYFYWENPIGLIVLWNGPPSIRAGGSSVPHGVQYGASYVQDLKTGKVLKDRHGILSAECFEGALRDDFLPDEAKVAIVMES